jgi:hypothetical protein
MKSLFLLSFGSRELFIIQQLLHLPFTSDDDVYKWKVVPFEKQHGTP